MSCILLSLALLLQWVLGMRLVPPIYPPLTSQLPLLSCETHIWNKHRLWAYWFWCEATISLINHKMMAVQQIYPVKHFCIFHKHAFLYVKLVGIRVGLHLFPLVQLVRVDHNRLHISLWLFLPVDIPQRQRDLGPFSVFPWIRCVMPLLTACFTMAFNMSSLMSSAATQMSTPLKQ